MPVLRGAGWLSPTSAHRPNALPRSVIFVSWRPDTVVVPAEEAVPMRFNRILAAIAALLAIGLVAQSVRTDSRIAELEAELDRMHTNLKQFAMPMDDLRSDIAGIFAELDALESSRTRPRQTRAEPAEEKPAPVAREAWPPVSSAPPVVGNGMVYSGDYGIPGVEAGKSKHNAPPEDGVSRFSMNKVVDEEDQ
jgi:hypothetical protein